MEREHNMLWASACGFCIQLLRAIDKEIIKDTEEEREMRAHYFIGAESEAVCL